MTGPRAVAKRRWPGTLIITAVLTLTCIALSGPPRPTPRPRCKRSVTTTRGPRPELGPGARRPLPLHRQPRPGRDRDRRHRRSPQAAHRGLAALASSHHAARAAHRAKPQAAGGAQLCLAGWGLELSHRAERSSAATARTSFWRAISAPCWRQRTTSICFLRWEDRARSQGNHHRRPRPPDSRAYRCCPKGETIDAPALTAMLKQIVANNRAGGWRRLKREG